MSFCDTHIHLLAPEWRESVASCLEVAREAGIKLLLQPGVWAADWDDLSDLAGKTPMVYMAPGVHPLAAESWTSALAAQLKTLTQNNQTLAIGEIGLDGILDVNLAVQEEAFRAQLEIALEVELPVLIHCRKRTAAVLVILHELRAQRIGGIWHGFSGSLEVAKQILDLGFLLGIGPVLLRENVRKLPEVVKAVPATSLVLETDAPDMATGPEILLDVAQKLAELRGWTLDETARITTANAQRLLKPQGRIKA